MLLILYSQPLLSLFCEVQNLDTEGFQLAGSLLQHSDLMRDRNVGKVRIDDLYNLVIVIGQFLKLKIKLVVSSDELHFRRGASDDDELLGEDTFYDKSASIAGSVPGCNITTVRHEKNRRTDWSGHKTRMHHK